MYNITIWSDFACPFCYIGEKRLKNAIKELGAEHDVQIEYRAFELNPDASSKPDNDVALHLAEKYGITIEEAKKRIEHIDRLGRDLGIDMHFGKVRYSKTFDAHRLMKFAETQYETVIKEAFNEALFDAYFSKSRSLSDHRLLLQLAAECGIDPTQAKEVLKSDLYAEQVRFDEKEAAMRGIHGVPYILLDGRIAVPGAISTEDFKMALQEMMAKKNKSHIEAPRSDCDADDCSL